MSKEDTELAPGDASLGRADGTVTWVGTVAELEAMSPETMMRLTAPIPEPEDDDYWKTAFFKAGRAPTVAQAISEVARAIRTRGTK